MSSEPEEQGAPERLEAVRDLIIACQRTLPSLPMHHMGSMSQLTLPVSAGVFVTIVCNERGLLEIDPLLAAARAAFLRKRGQGPDDAELN